MIASAYCEYACTRVEIAETESHDISYCSLLLGSSIAAPTSVHNGSIAGFDVRADIGWLYPSRNKDRDAVGDGAICTVND
jgi:hypothetical protein